MCIPYFRTVQRKARFTRGSSINYVDNQGGGKGSAKCQRYYMSLFSKLVNEATKGRGGVKNPHNFVNVVYGCPLELNKLLCFCVVVTPCIQSYCKKVFSLGAFCSGKKG